MNAAPTSLGTCPLRLRPVSRTTLARILLFVTALCNTVSQASAATRLEEAETDKRVFNVKWRLEVNGKLETALQGGKAQGHDLSVSAAFDYRERRLSGTGRDAKTLRSLRYY